MYGKHAADNWHSVGTSSDIIIVSQSYLRMVSYFNCTTGKVSHSVKDHTWSARPAAIAGVRFCHPPAV